MFTSFSPEAHHFVRENSLGILGFLPVAHDEA